MTSNVPDNFATAQGAVQTGFQNANSVLQGALGSMNGAIAQLGSFDIPAPQAGNLTGIQSAIAAITAATIVDPGQVTLTPPTISTMTLPSDPSFADAPPIDTSGGPSDEPAAPSINMPTVPSPLAVSAPGDVPLPSTVTLPTAPSTTLPAEPALRGVNLPATPTLDLPTFTAVFAAPLPVLPSTDVHYDDTPYASTELDAVRTRIASMLDGGNGLPVEIERAIFDRGRAREDLLARKAVQEATEEWSSRGFDLPAGELQRLVQEARQKNQDAAATLNRDLTIQTHQAALENLRVAITQGVALEGTLIQSYNQAAQRALDFALGVARIKVEYFNAQITLYNADLHKVEVLAGVYKTQIEAEAQKIALYKEQIEAQALIQQINEADVRLYTAKVQALLVAVQVYTAEIEGVKAQLSVDQLKVEVYKAGVEGYSAQVQAKAAEFGAYAEQVRAESTKAQIFTAQVQAFAERIRAYTAKVEAQATAARSVIEENRSRAEILTARLGVFREQVNERASGVAAVAQLATAEATVYGGKVSLAEAQGKQALGIASLSVDAARASDALQLQQTQILVEASLRSAQVLEHKLATIAQVFQSVVSSALAAFNFGAQISSHSQSSGSTSLGVNWNASVDAANPGLSYL